MAATLSHREKVYRTYMEFFEVAERKRRWNLWDDIPWDKHDPKTRSEENRIRVETACGVELYVPDYTKNGFNWTRNMFGQAWFQANWGYEESKHALVMREYLVRTGLRTPEEFDAYEQTILSQEWIPPFETARRMTIYGAFQEIATYLNYHQNRQRALAEGDELLERIWFFVSRDEAAHAGFYRKVIALELEEDREGTLADLAHVVKNFRMPATNLIPDYESRLEVTGVQISRERFLRQGIFPTLKQFGTSRAELSRAMRRSRAKAAESGVQAAIA